MTAPARTALADVPVDRSAQANPMGRIYLVLIILFPIGALLYIGFSTFKPGVTSVANPAPVHAVHASWEADCNKCHSGSARISGTWGDTHTGDQKCTACHAGPAHHAALKDREEESCAACHREHQGREHSLLAMDDSHCTNCHTDPGSHTKSSTTTLKPVMAMSEDPGEHPEIKWHRDKLPNPRTLKFNHQVHLKAGLHVVMDPKEIPETITLECSSCHQLDATDKPMDKKRRFRIPGNAVEPGQADGARFLPITFEKHCQDCHPLSVSPGHAAKELDIPHRLGADQLRELIEGHITSLAWKGQLPAPKGGAPALPGKRPKPPLPAEESVRKWVRIGEKELRDKTCNRCHAMDQPKDGNEILGDVKPVNIPKVWMPSVKFSHASHRHADCKTCHPNVRDTGPGTATVLMPRIEDCRQCHTSKAARPLQPARSNCTQCHRYHALDHPELGRGGQLWNPPSRK